MHGWNETLYSKCQTGSESHWMTELLPYMVILWLDPGLVLLFASWNEVQGVNCC